MGLSLGRVGASCWRRVRRLAAATRILPRNGSGAANPGLRFALRLYSLDLEESQRDMDL